MRSKNTLPTFLLATLLLSGMVAGCAAKPARQAATEPAVRLDQLDRDPRVLGDSELDLIYLFGRDKHHFRAEARDQKVRARALVDKDILREGTFEASRYRQLLQRVAQFASDQAGRQPAASGSGNRAGCRTPFLLRARIGESTYLLNGCRHTDAGLQFGRLVRDAEFMLVAPTSPAPKGQ